MMRAALVWLTLLWTPASMLAQRHQTIFGTVRQLGDSSIRIPGAEILIGKRTISTDAQGRFRIDSLSLSRFPVRVRRIGYHPVHSRIEIVAGPPMEVEFRMEPAPVLLPALEVEARRTGIYGIVGDTAFRPLPGATVSAIGPGGGDATTDSLGRFAFPKAIAGTYLVQVRYPGHADRRLVVEVPRGSGKELTVRLGAATGVERSRVDGAALFELRHRLSFAFRDTRMAPEELARFGSMRLCDVPKILAIAGDPADVILNGVDVLEDTSLCYWRMDEIALIEFCGRVACFNPQARVIGGNRGPRRARTGTIIIWEKR